jgi:DNA polymerase III psi subunit
MTPVPAISMPGNRQQAYLDAMDITVWRSRESVISEAGVVENHARLRLGPGSGGILLICTADSDSAGRLANDINRVLGGTPVWAWPYADDVAVDLTRAVEENLFTTVAFFGQELALQFFDGELPAHLNSAKLVLLPSMQDIQNQAGARRVLWATFCQSGMLGNLDHKT